ncbi:MAG TPA: hypothetical protein VN725_07350 [Rhodanobacteraceae bacterium]|nr:hypothetical protein [Rhodanobacteraceae bacterium]
MSYFRALAEREQAFERCLQARKRVHTAAGDVSRAYRAYPLPVLAGSVIVGVVLAQWRVGRGLVMAGSRLVGGPVAGLLKKFISTF